MFTNEIFEELVEMEVSYYTSCEEHYSKLYIDFPTFCNYIEKYYKITEEQFGHQALVDYWNDFRVKVDEVIDNLP